MNRSARDDAVGGLLVLAVVAVFIPVTSQIFVDPRDPGFGSRDFPIGVLTSITILALALSARAVYLISRSGWQFYEAGEARPVLSYLLPIVALGFFYVWLLEMFQYALPTVFALAASLAIFGNKGHIRLVVIPIVVTIIFYVLFYGVFGLNEPPGVILSYENNWYFQPFRKFLGLS